MSLAYELKVPLEEVESWPIEKIAGWIAYFKVKGEKERQRSQNPTKASKPPRMRRK